MGSLRRLLLAAVLPLAAGLAVAGCALGQSESVEDCMRDFPAGMRSTMPPVVAAEVSAAELSAASRGLCEDLVGRVPDDADETDVRRIMSETVRARPETWRPICGLLVEADVRLTGEALRYVRDRDLARYRGTYCDLTVRYMRSDFTVDTTRLLTENIGLWAPFCAAGIELELTGRPETRGLFRPRDLHTIATQTCSRAVRAGMIDVSGPEGFSNPRIDEQRMLRLFMRVAAKVSRGRA